MLGPDLDGKLVVQVGQTGYFDARPIAWQWTGLAVLLQCHVGEVAVVVLDTEALREAGGDVHQYLHGFSHATQTL